MAGSVRGPQGLVGPRGDRGPTGFTGRTGTPGTAGARGVQGPIGKTGARGERGPAGATGASGSVANIEHDVAPNDVGIDGIPGSSQKAAAANHVHRGVRSVRSNSNPQLFGDISFAEGTGVSMAQVGNTITVSSTGSAPTGPAGGDLDGFYPDPLVSAVHSGATRLTFGAIADGQYVKRSALAFVGVSTIPFSDITGAPAAITALTGDVTATGPGSAVATITTNAVSDTKFRQSVGTSVVGRSANSTGNIADIVASADGQFLGRVGGALVWTSTIASTSAPLAAGAIGFGSAGGLLTGDVANAHWDSTNLRAGFRTSAPAYQVHLVDQAGAVDRGLAIGQHVTTPTDATAPMVNIFRSRGTFASPSTVTNTDYLGRLAWLAHDGTNFLQTGALGSHVTNGATVATGSIPTDMWLRGSTSGNSSQVDPYAGAGATLALRTNSSNRVMIGINALTADPGYSLAVGGGVLVGGAGVPNTLTFGTTGSQFLNQSQVLIMNNNANDGQVIRTSRFARSRGTSASPTVVGPADTIGGFGFWGHDGTIYALGKAIRTFVNFDATVTSGSVPMDWAVFNGDGTGLPHLYAGSSGDVVLGDWSQLTTSSTVGFPRIASTPGVPTGTPQTIRISAASGATTTAAALTYDSTHGRLYANVGSWAPVAQDTTAMATGYMRSTTSTGVWSTVATIPASDVTGLFYQTAQNAGAGLTQRPIYNFAGGLQAVDNAGATRTDVSVATNGIANTMLRQGAGLSVIGNSTNALANVADIVAGSDGFVLRRSGTTLGFGTLGVASVPALSATFITQTASPDLANEQALGSLATGYMRSANTSGVVSTVATIPYADITGAPSAITSLTTDVVAVGPGAAAATIQPGVVTYAKIQDISAASRILGRGSAGGSGSTQELTLGSGLTLTGTVLSATGTGGTVTSVGGTPPIVSSGGTTPIISVNIDGSLGVSADNLQRAALTGDISAPAGSNATTLATVNSNVGTFTYGTFTVNAKGLITAASSGATPALASVTLTAGAGLTGGGDLSANRTFDVVAGDATIVVNANDIVAGVMQTANYAANSVTNAKLAQMAATTIKGNVTAGLANATDLTGTQVTTMLDVFTTSLKGLVPAGTGGAGTFLQHDGTWAVPAGTGGGITQLTGDVTAGPGSGSVATTIVNIPTGTTMAGSLLATAIAAPGTPAAGKGSIYVDSTSKNLAMKDDAGVVKHGVQTAVAVTHQFVTAISDAGVVTLAQPVVADVTGAESTLTFSTGLTRTSNTITANLSTGVVGGQTVIGGTAASNSLTYSSTSNATKGSHVFGTTTGMVYNEATGHLALGVASPDASATAQFTNNTNGIASVYVSNNSAGGSAFSGFVAGQSSSASGTTPTIAMYMGGSSNSNPFYGANAGVLELYGGSGTGANGDFIFSIVETSGGYLWKTGTTPTDRMSLSSAGTLTVTGLGTGLVKTVAGAFANASASDIAAAQVWPAAERILTSTGPSTAPIGRGQLIYDPDDLVTLAGADLASYNIGSHDADANYERLRGFWSSSIFTFATERKGTGTLRDFRLSAGTAGLRLTGGNVYIENLTTNGYVKTSSGTGHLSVSTSIPYSDLFTAALSVIGRPGGSAGAPSDITAANNGDVLWMNGGGLGFAPYDTASLHFFINDAAAAGIFSSGYLVPSSSTALTGFGAIYIPYVPSTTNIFKTGELVVYLVGNGITAGSYNLQVLKNGVSISGSGVSVTAGSPAVVSAAFSTGSASATDGYTVLVSGSTGAADTITYTAVLRLSTKS